MCPARADVVVVGAGLVGLALAYELACLGTDVAVVDAGRPGRATDAGAGILSPATSVEADDELWPFLRWCGEHYPDLLTRLAHDGADVAAAGYGACGILSVGLRAQENEWFAPFAASVLARAPGAAGELAPDEARLLFPPLGRVHRVLHVPGAARVDGRGLAAALRAAAGRRNVSFVEGAVAGVRAADGRRTVTAVRIEEAAGAPTHELGCDAVVVAGGAWSAAMGEWFGRTLPVQPTKGQIVHLGVEAETAAWPIVQPLLTHYLVPWPGGRIACGGTFEPSAGFSVSVTAAGLHELLRECLVVAPGLSSASYLETRVGLRPTSTDGRALVGRIPGWGNAWLATGHGANGLLQGPGSARALAHVITAAPSPTEEPPLPDSFDPARVA
jgi:D-amino-acid dehydrogenase